jgi:hypothetical protein
MKRKLSNPSNSGSPDKKPKPEASESGDTGMPTDVTSVNQPERKVPVPKQKLKKETAKPQKPSPKSREQPISVEDLEGSERNTETPKKAKLSHTPSEPKEGQAATPKRRDAKTSKAKLTPRKKDITYRGLGAKGDAGQRKTQAALLDARKKRIGIVQFGGGTGSNAGDAALTSLLGSRRRAATDLGGGLAQSGALKLEAKNIQLVDPENSDASEADTASESEDAEDKMEIAEKQPELEEPPVLSDEPVEQLLVVSEESVDNLSVPKEEKKTDNTPQVQAAKKNAKQLLIITHWHKDHAGDPATLWQSQPATNNIAAILGSKGATETDPKPTLIYGQREPTEDYKGVANTMTKQQVTTNGEKLFAWKTKPGKVKKDLPKPGELRVEGRAIQPPNVALKPKAQNTESLGVLTMVNKYGDAGATERLFTMVSLGDMDGVKKAEKLQVADLVKDAQTTYSPDIPVDVVKISHHGSENNLDVIPDGLIGNSTTVVISGYTKTEPKKLIAKIDEWAAKQVVLLVQDKETLGVLQGLGSAWTRLSAKVVVANNLVMTVDDDGSVNLEATAFD